MPLVIKFIHPLYTKMSVLYVRLTFVSFWILLFLQNCEVCAIKWRQCQLVPASKMRFFRHLIHAVPRKRDSLIAVIYRAGPMRQVPRPGHYYAFYALTPHPWTLCTIWVLTRKVDKRLRLPWEIVLQLQARCADYVKQQPGKASQNARKKFSQPRTILLADFSRCRAP